MTDQEMILAGVGVSNAVRGVLTIGGTRELLLVGTIDCYDYTKTENIQAFRVLCTERLHYVNVFRLDNSNSSFTTISFACSSIQFLSGIISLSVDYKRRHISEYRNANIHRRANRRYQKCLAKGRPSG